MINWLLAAPQKSIVANVKIFAMEIFINQSITGKIYSANMMFSAVRSVSRKFDTKDVLIS